jgi:septal ring factor EnvC (AmiA/AmiB activator)
MLMAPIARGQDVKPEDLQRMYKDTLVQLKAAQDRKAELGTQNEKLTARVAELEKQAQASGAQIDELKRQVADFSDRTFFLRSSYAAWQQFLANKPDVRMQWQFFLQSSAPTEPMQGPVFMDPEWPLSAKG